MKKNKLLLNNKEIIFNYPEGDDGIFGMFSCLRENKFHLQEIDFNDGDYFIDIGCNVGILSIIVATLFPKINVISIDASAEVIECLNESIKDNNLSNIKTYNYAVGSKEDKLKFFSDGKNSCLVEGDLAYSSEGNKNTTFAIEVDQIKIDKIFDEYCEKNNVKYLKMDIEGGEFDVFDRLFSERKDILSKIKFLHLEIHKFKHKPYKQLEENVKNIFGSRVFFDT